MDIERFRQTKADVESAYKANIDSFNAVMSNILDYIADDIKAKLKEELDDDRLDDILEEKVLHRYNSYEFEFIVELSNIHIQLLKNSQNITYSAALSSGIKTLFEIKETFNTKAFSSINDLSDYFTILSRANENITVSNNAILYSLNKNENKALVRIFYNHLCTEYGLSVLDIRRVNSNYYYPNRIKITVKNPVI